MKVLDFNSFIRPALHLVMKDDQQTTVDVTAPTTGMVEEVRANLPTLQAVLRGEQNEAQVAALYDLAARLITCNADGLQFTAETLRKQKRLKLYDLSIFYTMYVEFLDEIKHAKN